MTVITISRQYGSGGDEIVNSICHKTGYHQFGKFQISQAAFEAGLSSPEAIDYSEDNYKVKNFFERLFKRPVRVTQVHVWREDMKGTRSVETIDIDEKAALNLVQRAIRAAYEAGNMVIVGRGGMMLLRGKEDVLHVSIESRLEDRIQRIKQQLKNQRKAYGENLELRREAQDIIAAHDHASAAYIQEFYRADWNDPLLYDLIINTSEIDLETAADIIVERVNLLKAEAIH